MTKRVLITGALGFVGHHLAMAARKEGAEVFGLGRRAFSGREPEPFDHFLMGDIADLDFATAAVTTAAPSHVFHLAGLIGSEVSPYASYRAHVLGTAALFEGLRRASLRPRVVISSSSAVYGASSALPVTEGEPVNPVSLYGFSKAAQEVVVRQFMRDGADAMIVRPFNLIGPGLSDKLMPGAVARQIAECEQRGQHMIAVGNLGARRDYTDVRDAADAYLLIAGQGEAGETYNLCSGRSRSVRELAELLVKNAAHPMELVADEARMRPNETTEQVGSNARLRERTNWKPAVSFGQSVTDLLESWRRRVKEKREVDGTELAG